MKTITILYKKYPAEEFNLDETSIRETGNFFVLEFFRLDPDTGLDRIWRTRYIPIEKINEVVIA